MGWNDEILHYLCKYMDYSSMPVCVLGKNLFYIQSTFCGWYVLSSTEVPVPQTATQWDTVAHPMLMSFCTYEALLLHLAYSCRQHSGVCKGYHSGRLALFTPG